ncbi:HET-domain-containing protein [Aaosphaeria arxii CBS 175.79]|uniref:HET-domain-containing protein n=1 Tax=Aaosphaeria arxii CBS 175.79 TaxID=1450172 RepID=A0A6A5Y0T2_9PLEO|nr:HET-domain-containing protein [Aaosphaeria arxii CBS 175.79]KAF2018164.1 HET-domain-containing protein [Aaosphaeria arxii CBS 175.79]
MTVTIESYQEKCVHIGLFAARLALINSFFKTCIACLVPHRSPLYKMLPYTNSIRLLRIHSSRWNKRIVCTLEPARLDVSSPVPEYEALSYVWHLRGGVAKITVNGHTKFIQRNLYDALQRLRYRNKERVMWVDALCLNQEDMVEKSKQLRMMHHVYQKACRVIVWLGEDDRNEAHKAFDTICAVANTQVDKPLSYTSNHRRNSVRKVPYSEEIPSPEDDRWLPVETLFNNVWWTRIWVLQEITNASKASFLWGKAMIDWNVIRYALEAFYADYYLLVRLERRGMQNAWLMHHLSMDTLRGEFRPSFLDLLDVARGFDATKEQDKVYGLLGLPTKTGDVEEEVFLQPDCALSVAEVYTQVALKMIKQQQNLNLLSYTVHTDPDFDSHDNEVNLPSWIPDWTVKTARFSLIGIREEHRHNAGKGRDLDLALLPDSMSPKSHVSLKGSILDKVTEIEDGQKPVSMENALLSLTSLLEWCLEHAKGISLQTLCQTLTAARDADGHFDFSTDNKYVLHFAAFLNTIDADRLGPDILNEIAGLGDLVKSVGDGNAAREAVWKYTAYRSMFVTERGKLALGPTAVKEGDSVVALWGGQMLYVVRKAESGEEWKFVGECYIDGWMDGEASQLIERGDAAETIFQFI